MSREKVHPSSRIILLDRDCNWRKHLPDLENKLRISGWVYFVIYAEAFSGRFRLECVENSNKYLQKGYISTFFDKQDPSSVKGSPFKLYNSNKSATPKLLPIINQPKKEQS